jgi:hypothetical protein
LLRDSQYLARQAFIEFNLQEMFANELFADFQLFVRLVHRSRLPKSLADADQCLLERYYRQTIEQGNRVRDKLRDGVEKALNILGTALLQHPKNQQQGKGQKRSIKARRVLSATFAAHLSFALPSGRRGTELDWWQFGLPRPLLRIKVAKANRGQKRLG